MSILTQIFTLCALGMILINLINFVFVSGRRYGAFLGHAHVHHLGLAEDRHEGRRTSAGLGSAPQKGFLEFKVSYFS